MRACYVRAETKLEYLMMVATARLESREVLAPGAGADRGRWRDNWLSAGAESAGITHASLFNQMKVVS